MIAAPTRSRSGAPPRRTPFAFTLALLAVLPGSGCSLPGSGSQNPFEPRRASQIRIEVINNNFNDATLHARRGNERQRLGVVTGKSGATYVIDWPISMPLQIEIALLAGGSCRTGTLQVDPGTVVELQIQADVIRGGQCQGLRGR